MPDIFTETHRRVNALERQVNSLSRRGKAHGWQLLSSFDMHRYGGGRLMWQFDGQGVHVGAHNSIWTENNIDPSNYRAATYGGPNIVLNGSDEYLSIIDAPWQETGTEELLVWGWCYPTNIGSDRTVVAKYDTTGGNWRSWRLWYENVSADFTWTINSTGLAGGNVSERSTHGNVLVDNWYFVAGYFEPSTLMRIYVGHSSDIGLAIDSKVLGIPASLFDGGTKLTIGADGDPATYFIGRIGKILGRANVPSTNIDEHVGMLFQSTRDFYAE